MTNRISRIAYQDGKWRPANQLSLSVNDLAVTQAVTAVERIRTYHGKWFELDRHLKRWQRTLSELSIVGLPATDQFVELLDELLERNSDWIGDQEQFGAVMFASPGAGSGAGVGSGAGSGDRSSSRPTLVVDLWPIDSSLVQRRLQMGSPLAVTSVVQPSNLSWSRNIKVRCRLHYYLAEQAAKRIDGDAVGILVDSDGTVTESSIANVVIVENGDLLCPESDQILDGVTLQVVRELAGRIGVSFSQERLSPDRLRAADEVLLTGTSCGVWFANSVDGSERRGPGTVFQTIRNAFDSYCRE